MSTEYEGTAELRSTASMSEAAVGAELGAAAVEPKPIGAGDVLHVLAPPGYEPRRIDAEDLLDHPRRAKGTVIVRTVDDLVRYVRRHDDANATTLWVDPDLRAPKVVAVINDHETGDNVPDAGWGDHRAQLPLALTPEWLHWTQHDGGWLGQEDFAEHVQIGLGDFVIPIGTEMLEIAQTLQGSVGAEWRSGTRLADGQVQLEYVETRSAKAGEKNNIEIPAEFTLGLSPFLGEEKFEVLARFYYRVSGSTIKMRYQLHRPHLVLQNAVDEIADRLHTEFPLDGVDPTPQKNTQGEELPRLDGRVFIGTPRS
jgi:uncharacterized protein YfdQ (DUF2303 family)